MTKYERTPLKNGMPELYDYIASRLSNIQLTTPLEESGFKYSPETSVKTGRGWRPVGLYPKDLVGHVENASATVQFVGERIVIGIVAGGEIPWWARKRLTNTFQYIDIIFNGWRHVRLPFLYDGGDKWSYHIVEGLGSIEASELWACEIEREGALLFSGRIDSSDGLEAERIKVISITEQGRVIGFGKHADVDGKDVFLKLITGSDESVIHTNGQWRDKPLRKFSVPLGLAENEVQAVSIQTLSGAEAERSPMWAVRTTAGYFLMANPRIDGGCALVTVIGSEREDLKPVALIPVDDEAQERFDVEHADERPFIYPGGRNTVRLPMARVRSGTAFRMINSAGQSLGILPGLHRLFVRK